MVQQSATEGVSLQYIKTIGNAAAPGQIGFRNPVDVALGRDGVVYVLSHAAENSPSAKRVARCTLDDDFLGEFGSFGTEEGQFTWPNSLVTDSEGHVYVTDEWLQTVSVFDAEGNYLRRWGSQGNGSGQWDRPAGIALGQDGNLLIADSMNHRIQKYTRSGEFISQWGEMGEGPGQFNTPWGITVDSQGDVYVADWRNDRIQKLSPEGRFILQVGRSGSNEGELNRPSGVAVDKNGRIYVADWGNDRVQVFGADGRFLLMLLGDAGLSKWGIDRLSSNPENMLEQRAKARSLDPEKRFVHPVAIEIDSQERVIIVDGARHRLQIYQS